MTKSHRTYIWNQKLNRGNNNNITFYTLKIQSRLQLYNDENIGRQTAKQEALLETPQLSGLVRLTSLIIASQLLLNINCYNL